jgi:hypothetical protein
VTTVQVPHNVGGRLVGTIPAFSVVTQKQAQTEGALSFTFGRDIWMAGRFSALQPQNDNESVGGQGGAAWNADRMREAIRNVHVDGSLPPAKVSAAARGKVVDVYGHPVMGATVVLQHKSGRAFRKLATGRTDALGRFSLRAKARGVFRVVASLAGSSATGKTFRQ